MSNELLKRDLVDAISMMERADLMDFNGHFSARLPGSDHFLINSGKSNRAAMRMDDIVCVNLDGKLVEGHDAPPLEVYLHAEIYRRRPDVQAVVHAHPPWSTLFTSAGIELKPVIMQAAVLGEIIVFDKTCSINDKPIGEEASAALGRNKVLLLRAHGMAVAANNIKEAFVYAVYLEQNAHRQYLSRQLGEPYVLSPEEYAAAAKNLARPNLILKVWEYYRAKLK